MLLTVASFKFDKTSYYKMEWDTQDVEHWFEESCSMSEEHKTVYRISLWNIWKSIVS